jgi:flagellar hook-associated protein 1 FlgK
MSLTSALRIAQNSLLNTARQTIVASRNISEASNENYVRRDPMVVSSDAGARVVNIRRNTNIDLFWHSLNAKSESTAQSFIADTATRLQRLVNGVDNSTAPSTLIASFKDALQLYSSEPSNTLLATSAVTFAKELSDGLNTASLAVQEFRSSIDADLEDEVGKFNSLLTEFKQVNDEVVQGTRSGTDVNDALDRRDTLLKDISEYVSVSVVQRADNDYALYTGQGVTLFETVPRTVSFDPLTTYAPGITGNAIRIDGVPVIGGTGSNSSASGTFAAMIQMRDTVAVQMQSQLDEIARGLITTFAETDQTGGGGPDLAGLFTYAGGPAIPAAGTISTGIALTLGVNGAFDPAVGGDPTLLRDGGANGAAYVANTTGGSAFSDHLIGYVEAMSDPLATDINAGIAGSYSVSGYAETSLGWLESLRSTASSASDSKYALYERLNEAHFASTGVSIDEEMSILIDLEQSYEASARILAAVGQMMDELLAAVR